jgi:hypothetical protein
MAVLEGKQDAREREQKKAERQSKRGGQQRR